MTPRPFRNLFRARPLCLLALPGALAVAVVIICTGNFCKEQAGTHAAPIPVPLLNVEQTAIAESAFTAEAEPMNAPLEPGAGEGVSPHEGSICPWRIEYLPLTKPQHESVANHSDESQPRFRYIVRENRPHGRSLSFTSRYRYGQAWGIRHLLLLSTSGAQDEYHEETMGFIILDTSLERVLEDVLQLEPLDANEICSGVSHVCWDGVDEQGNRCGGTYTCMDWHHAASISGSDEGVCVQLGTNSPNNCRITWAYKTASGTTHLYKGHPLSCVFALFQPASGLPHRCTPLPLEPMPANAHPGQAD